MALLVILSVFSFLFGICIGSFLNVVIHRLPRGLSLASPPSSCPSCGYRIPFYLNVPLLSWLILRGKCRNCKAPISPRYFVVELFTGLCFLALMLCYFHWNVRNFGFLPDIHPPAFFQGGWLIYLLHVILIASFIAASAIDLELWVIPLSICWFVTLAGLIISSLSSYVLDFEMIRQFHIFPTASTKITALTFGTLIGLAISLVLLFTGIFKQSYPEVEQLDPETAPKGAIDSDQYNDRLEILKELLFLTPVIICSIISFVLFKNLPAFTAFLEKMNSMPAICNFSGSLWGYFIGCAVVWATRILGTLAFGKEAMGMGDVHLMGAAGAVIGAVPVTVAFFLAPFFGLAWAIFQAFFKKTRQIPYGPFLSIAVILVMILHDVILQRLSVMFMIKF